MRRRMTFRLDAADLFELRFWSMRRDQRSASETLRDLVRAYVAESRRMFPAADA